MREDQRKFREGSVSKVGRREGGEANHHVMLDITWSCVGVPYRLTAPHPREGAAGKRGTLCLTSWANRQPVATAHYSTFRILRFTNTNTGAAFGLAVSRMCKLHNASIFPPRAPTPE